MPVSVSSSESGWRLSRSHLDVAPGRPVIQRLLAQVGSSLQCLYCFCDRMHCMVRPVGWHGWGCHSGTVHAALPRRCCMLTPPSSPTGYVTPELQRQFRGEYRISQGRDRCRSATALCTGRAPPTRRSVRCAGERASALPCNTVCLFTPESQRQARGQRRI